MNKRFIKAIENTEKVSNPVFVVGSPRSGTSMLARAIAINDSICYLEEQGLFSKFYLRSISCIKLFTLIKSKVPFELIIKALAKKILLLSDKKKLLKSLVIQIIKHSIVTIDNLKPSGRLVEKNKVVLNNEENELYNLLYNKYLSVLNKSRSYENLISIILKDFSILSNKEIVLEKSPEHISYIYLIKKILPNAKFIHIIRNGRDVISSYIQPSFKSSNKYKNPAKKIAKMHKFALKVDKNIIKKKYNWYINVSYNEFLSDPFKTIKEINSFINIENKNYPEKLLKEIQPTKSNYNKLDLEEKRKVDNLLNL